MISSIFRELVPFTEADESRQIADSAEALSDLLRIIDMRIWESAAEGCLDAIELQDAIGNMIDLTARHIGFIGEQVRLGETDLGTS
ncbi:MAG TPA: hypothetical protein PLS46_00355 [Microthrixaceae bacterium]|nr:hypothetical protein [Microthrixaceae bacterium]